MNDQPAVVTRPAAGRVQRGVPNVVGGELVCGTVPYRLGHNDPLPVDNYADGSKQARFPIVVFIS